MCDTFISMYVKNFTVDDDFGSSQSYEMCSILKKIIFKNS